ncbi:MAG: hypothetical protein AMXMBFR33_58850 [Candidatus Xenobia bacterium]
MLPQSPEALRRQLEDRTLECRLREQINRLLVRGAPPEELMEAALRLVLELGSGWVSRVIFLEEGGQLVPARFSSPHAERLGCASLLQVSEPLVDQCWRQKAVLAMTAERAVGPRLLEGESNALALPIPRQGVLYVSREPGVPFEERDHQWLTLLVGQLSPALEFSRRYATLERESEQMRRHEHALSEWAAGLKRLLEAAGQMAASLESGLTLIVSHLEETLTALFPGCDFAVALLHEGSWQVVRSNCEPDPAGFEQLVARFEAGESAVFLGNLSDEPPLWPWQRSFSAVSLRGERGLLGGIALCDRSLDAFRTTERDLLAALAYQASAALSGAWLHAELQQAYQHLRDSRSQLVQSSKLAAVGELAAGVAHELNTPLGTVLLSLDSTRSALDSGRSEAALKRLERARGEVMRAREIVAKLLYYARDAASAGRQSVSGEQLVRDTLGLIGHQLETGGVRVSTLFEKAPSAYCNANEIQQVLINLLLNARDAVGERGGEVQVTVRAEGDRVVLEVADNGPGVPPEVEERIFDPFFTTKPVGRGTGLGLSVSKQIVELHQGQLTFCRRPGGGACFQVRLPSA